MDASTSKLISFFKTDSASFIIFSVSLGTTFSEVVSFNEETLINKSPFETLSPILTFIDSTSPSIVEGTSTLDLSLSIVTTGSLSLILSPVFTKIYIISTSSKSPMSGTSNFLIIILNGFIYFSYLFVILLAHLKPFLDNLICHLFIMFTFILKKIIN